ARRRSLAPAARPWPCPRAWRKTAGRTRLHLPPSRAMGGSMGHADDEGRPAVAHHARGVGASRPVDAAPRAFTIPTWWRTSELALVVTNDGTVIVQPAFDASGSPIGVIRSDDGGAHWELVTPPDHHDPSRELKVDQDMVLDRDTGRIFWVSSG